MFELCPKLKSKLNPSAKSNECPFAFTSLGDLCCGMANSDCDPNGHSRVADLKYCPMERIKEIKEKKKKVRKK